MTVTISNDAKRYVLFNVATRLLLYMF